MQFVGIGFLVLIFFEIMSIVWVADWLGDLPTFLLMAASFVSGIFMLRHTGLSGVLLAGAAMRSGQNVSAYQLLWPVRYALAALMLMSPGFISSILALILLLPIKGKPIAVMTQTNNPFTQEPPFARPGQKESEENVIEGEFTTVTPVDPKQRKTDYIEHKPD